MVFICTDNNQLESIREEKNPPFTIALSEVKYLGTNVRKK
jgi:hypothetical protein